MARRLRTFAFALALTGCGMPFQPGGGPTLPILSQAPTAQGTCVAYCNGGGPTPPNNGAVTPVGKILLVTVLFGLGVFLVYMQVEHG